ncbi:MAG TPA: hypothetical protein PKD37_00280 [Oligoflexia bacterium]|nr:hypothetical protein [Oligoflexia bacterium]HMP26417.1 hypothetical protein [Oligoflexia bacterium]
MKHLNFAIFLISLFSNLAPLTPLAILAEDKQQLSQASSAINSTNQSASQPQLKAVEIVKLDSERLSELFQIGETNGLSGLLAFTAELNDGWSGIFVLDLDDRKVRSLIIQEQANNFYPTWAPDGKQLAFVSNRNGHNQIFTASWFGGNQKSATQSKAPEDHPSWSADGKNILFVSESGGRGRDANVKQFEIVSGKIIQLTSFKGRNSTPRLSPNNQIISYTTNRFWPGWDVCLLDLNTRLENCPLGGIKTYCRASWSTNSRLLVFSYGLLDDVSLGIYQLDTSKIINLNLGSGTIYDGIFMNQDHRILFSKAVNKSENFALFVAEFPKQDLTTMPIIKQLISSELFSLRYPSYTSAKTIDLEGERARALQQNSQSTITNNTR